jgi:RNA polymerase sigma-70 factor, ECF subfamily
VFPSPLQTSEQAARDRELTALIARVAGGDHDALTEVYDATNRLVYGLLLRILGNAATAEEVLSDVYVQAWRQASRYDERRGGPRAWLVMMARSRALDRLRADGPATRREASLEEAPSAASASAGDAERSAAQHELRRIVCAALDFLPPDQREVIELAFYSGLTHTELAARLNQPLGTIKTRLRRGMMRLREALAAAREAV